MTAFKDLVRLRRSHRKFSEKQVDPDDLQLIIRAALMSPTSKCRRDWQFVVVDDRDDIDRLSEAKSSGSQFLKGAPLAIVVLGNPDGNECWIEDASIAAISMQYQAQELGLGSCWIQMRERMTEDGNDSEETIRQILSIPQNMRVLCILAIGYSEDERKPQSEDRLKWENVHVGKYWPQGVEQDS